MKINKKILIFAILIGLVTVIGLSFYLKSLTSSEKIQTSYSKVVVAANIIPANVQITADMVKLKSVPTESVHPEALTDVEKVIGKTTSSEIIKGEQVLVSRVVTDTSKSNLAYRVPNKMRAVTIPSSEITGVAGYINVGDKIDILATYNKKEINPVPTTYTQLQNIEVAAIGSIIKTSDDGKEALPVSITVFVNPAQAEVLAFAVSEGSLYMTLRNPVDKGKADLSYYNSDNFSSYKER
ncbi:MAG: Flp pilus assembly protein CpaB [Bacillota bacterium]|nr:Flp pilus assembly protein CpaB [Bacillota bacterium]